MVIDFAKTEEKRIPEFKGGRADFFYDVRTEEAAAGDL